MDTSETQYARLIRQMQFIVEIDKAKSILRTGKHIHSDPRENDAEHSWHVAMMAIVLAEHAAEPVDVLRVVKMLLIHDIVEIDAGDTDAYDEVGRLTQRAAAPEEKAADRLFGLLPSDAAAEFRVLWEEFEAKATSDDVFAGALDRIAGVLSSTHNNGGCWDRRRHHA